MLCRCSYYNYYLKTSLVEKKKKKKQEKKHTRGPKHRLGHISVSFPGPPLRRCRHRSAWSAVVPKKIVNRMKMKNEKKKLTSMGGPRVVLENPVRSSFSAPEAINRNRNRLIFFFRVLKTGLNRNGPVKVGFYRLINWFKPVENR
jgi:hypothetical protein